MKNRSKEKSEKKVKGIPISGLEKERQGWKKMLNCACTEVKSCTCLIFKYD